MTISSRYLFVISGTLLATAMFLPFLQWPLGGPVSAYQIIRTPILFVSVFAVLGMALLWFKLGKLAWISVLGVWLTLIYPWIKQKLVPENQSIIEQLTAEATTAVMKYKYELLFSVDQYLWGAYAFWSALIMFTALGLYLTSKES